MKNKPCWLLLLVFLCEFDLIGKAQTDQWQSDIAKLKKTASILFIGVSPEDINYDLADYMLQKENCRVGFLSLTRGENSDIDDVAFPLEGVQRSIYHTNKAISYIGKHYSDLYFTRAYDFLSNNREDSISIFDKKWDRLSIMGDIVWDIRTFRPDVVVFPSYKNSKAIGKRYFALQMIQDAIKLASDSNYFKEQFDDNRYPNKIMRVLAIDSIHGTNSFVYSSSKQLKYDIVEGKKPTKSLMDESQMDWSRIYEKTDNGYYNRCLDSIVNLKLTNQEQLKTLLILRTQLNSAVYIDGYWRSYKDQQLDDLIFKYSGVKISIDFSQPFLVLGKPYSYTINYERNSLPLQLNYIQFGKFDSSFTNSGSVHFSKEFIFPQNEKVYQPYWMAYKMATPGMYAISDRNDLNSPTNFNPFMAKLIFSYEGNRFQYTLPAFYTKKQDSTREMPIVTIPGFSNIAPNMILTHLIPNRKSEKIYAQLQPNFSEKQVPLSINIMRQGVVVKREGGFSGGRNKQYLVSKDTIANLENGKTINWKFDLSQKILDTLNGDIGVEIWIGKEPNKLKINSSLIHIPLKGLPDIDYHYQPSAGILFRDTFRVNPRVTVGIITDSIINPYSEYVKMTMNSLHIDYKIIDSSHFSKDSLEKCDWVIMPMSSDSANDLLISQYVANGGNLVVIPSRKDTLPQFIQDSVAFEPYNLMVSNAGLSVNFNDSANIFSKPNLILADLFPDKGTISTINCHSSNMKQQYEQPIKYKMKSSSNIDETISPVLTYQYGKGNILLSSFYIDESAVNEPFIYKLWANILSLEGQNGIKK